jgi:hypothetical protein
MVEQEGVHMQPLIEQDSEYVVKKRQEEVMVGEGREQSQYQEQKQP